MSSVVYFFKWLLRGISEMAAWLVSLPSILISSVVGMYAAVTSMAHSLVGDSPTILTSAVTEASSCITSISNVVDSFPDILKVAFYALSLDVAFRFLFAAFYLFVGGTVLMLQFQLVTILGYNLIIFGYKMFSWFIVCFFPSAAAISGLKKMSSAEYAEIENNSN